MQKCKKIDQEKPEKNKVLHAFLMLMMCRRTRVAGYKLLVRDTCRLYLGDIITIHLSRSTCITLYPATDERQTGDNFVADTSYMLPDTSGYKYNLIVSWCKRGFMSPRYCPRVSQTSNLYPATCVRRHCIRIQVARLGYMFPDDMCPGVNAA